jgi:hypothetical protein
MVARNSDLRPRALLGLPLRLLALRHSALQFGYSAPQLHLRHYLACQNPQCFLLLGRQVAGHAVHGAKRPQRIAVRADQRRARVEADLQIAD